MAAILCLSNSVFSYCIPLSLCKVYLFAKILPSLVCLHFNFIFIAPVIVGKGEQEVTNEI